MRDAWILIIVLAIVQGLRQVVQKVVWVALTPIVMLIAFVLAGVLVVAENVRTKWLTSG